MIWNMANELTLFSQYYDGISSRFTHTYIIFELYKIIEGTVKYIESNLLFEITNF